MDKPALEWPQANSRLWPRRLVGKQPPTPLLGQVNNFEIDLMDMFLLIKSVGDTPDQFRNEELP
jgi:hypothetical protein